MVSMTGSVSAGEKIMATAGEKHHQSVSGIGAKTSYRNGLCRFLTGSQSHLVDSRVINSGQVCNCAERIYVQKGIYD
ncbi:aldehyde dehydrogenase family protein [Shigella flexneri]